MTQEFKDQNAILVDGRLLCRHFIYGRCVKVDYAVTYKLSFFSFLFFKKNNYNAHVLFSMQADGCQLEHVEAYNDLIKAACKFYIQGFCTKGAACPYMHNILSPANPNPNPNPATVSANRWMSNISFTLLHSRFLASISIGKDAAIKRKVANFPTSLLTKSQNGFWTRCVHGSLAE